MAASGQLEACGTLKRALPRPPLPALDDVPEDQVAQFRYLDDAMYRCCMSIRGLLIVGAEALSLRAAPLETPPDVVLCGLMVRCYKLYDSLLALALHGRYETALILLRALVDTVVNIAYLSRAQDPPAAAEAFIKSARAYDQENHAEHQGPSSFVAPGEDRVVGSTLRHLASWGLAPGPVSSADKYWSGRGGAKKRAESVGLLGTYFHSFAAGSHAVHGDWSDLVAFHLLEVTDGAYLPRLDYRGIHLALLEAASSLAVTGLRAEALPLVSEEMQPAFADLLDSFDAWLKEFDAAVVPSPLPPFDPNEHHRATVEAYFARLVGDRPDAMNDATQRADGAKHKAAAEAAITRWFESLWSALVPSRRAT
jgi:Family of unknown function (DUF5677)